MVVENALKRQPAGAASRQDIPQRFAARGRLLPFLVHDGQAELHGLHGFSEAARPAGGVLPAGFGGVGALLVLSGFRQQSLLGLFQVLQSACVVRQGIGRFALGFLQAGKHFLGFCNLAAQAGGLGFLRFRGAGQFGCAVAQGLEQALKARRFRSKARDGFILLADTRFDLSRSVPQAVRPQRPLARRAGGVLRCAGG